MKLFGKPRQFDPNRKVYDKAELYRKEKAKEKMTYEELDALQREKTKDLTNQILRVLGLLTALVIVILAIGTFLYPYSIFNWWGKTTFVDAVRDFTVHVSATNAEGGKEMITVSIKEILDMVYLGSTTVRGYVCSVGFIEVFYSIGFWTIPVIATVGFISIIIYAAYIVAYNIRDLIAVIKHFFKRAGYVVSDVAVTAAEGIDSQVDKKKKRTTTKKSSPKKEVEEVEIVTTRREEKAKDDTVGGYTPEQLDALLEGKSIDEVKAMTPAEEKSEETKNEEAKPADTETKEEPQDENQEGGKEQ
jgi:hypothetical protein